MVFTTENTPRGPGSNLAVDENPSSPSCNKNKNKKLRREEEKETQKIPGTLNPNPTESKKRNH